MLGFSDGESDGETYYYEEDSNGLFGELGLIADGENNEKVILPNFDGEYYMNKGIEYSKIGYNYSVVYGKKGYNATAVYGKIALNATSNSIE